MKIQKFEDTIAWQKAQELAVAIYGAFGKSRDFGFKDQICRASVSEVKSMLYLSAKLGYTDKATTNKLLSQCNETSAVLRGLIKSIK
jgi:hypothetical protein